DARFVLDCATALLEGGHIEEAMVEYQRAIALDPKLAEAHYNLGNAQVQLGRLRDGETSFRRAVSSKPKFAEAHCNLGHVLVRLGCFTEGAAELREGHALGQAIRGWPYPSARWVEDAERLAGAERR